MAAVTKTNIRVNSQAVVIAGSARGQWVTINADCKQVQTSAHVLNITGVSSDAYLYWIEVPPGVTRMLLRAKLPVAVTAVTQAPVIRVVGVWRAADASAITDAGAVPSDTTILTMRLDNATADATGVTLMATTAAAGVNANVFQNDATYYYGNPIDLTGYDLLGCDWVAVPVITAMTTTGAGACPIDALFLN